MRLDISICQHIHLVRCCLDRLPAPSGLYHKSGKAQKVHSDDSLVNETAARLTTGPPKLPVDLPLFVSDRIVILQS